MSMETLKVDTSNPDLFKPPEFKVITPGIHLFAVASISNPEPAKEGSNLVMKAEFRCQDEGESKGLPLFENFVIVQDAVTQKQQTARRINQQSMVQLCLACGVTTKEQVSATGEIPLKACVGQFFKADTGVRTNKYQGEDRKQAYVKKFLFEDAKS